MKNQLFGGIVLAALALPALASAEPRHDQKLERAAIEIAVAKLGALRGGLSYDAVPVRIERLDLRTTASIRPANGQAGVLPSSEAARAAAPAEGLAVAVERQTVRIVF